MGVGVREWGITRWEQVIIMGQRVRVGLRIGWQGKYVIVQDVISMGTSVRSHNAPHRRRNNSLQGSLGVGGVLGLALPLILI